MPWAVPWAHLRHWGLFLFLFLQVQTPGSELQEPNQRGWSYIFMSLHLWNIWDPLGTGVRECCVRVCVPVLW